MAKPGITPESRMRRRPQIRKISLRSAVHHIAGPEQPYPTLRFSGRVFVERPRHNPFAGLDRGVINYRDEFDRVTFDNGDWISLGLDGYQPPAGYPNIVSGVAQQFNYTYFVGAGRYTETRNHFIEAELVNVGGVYDFGTSIWLNVRGTVGGNMNDGWYGVITHEPTLNRMWLQIYRWDAPATYILYDTLIVDGVTSIPDGALFRVEADSGIIRCSVDLNADGNWIDQELELPGDDPYKQGLGVSFGIENYNETYGGIESIRIGVP